MSETYTINSNDLIPDTELEVRFTQIKELINKKTGKPFLLIKMVVRNDITENSVFKDREITDFFNKEIGTTRYKDWQIKALINTQDIHKYLLETGQTNINWSVEQIAVFLVGKNARVKIVITENEYGVKNEIKKYMKSQYVIKEKPKPLVVEDDIIIDDEEPILEDDDIYKDLPF